MKCLRILISILSLLTSNAIVSNSDTLKLKLIDADLKDGTRIWGFVIRETTDSISVSDLNIGKVFLSKSHVKNMVIKPITGQVIILTTNDIEYLGEITGFNDNSVEMHSNSIGTFSIQSNSITKITLSESFVNKKGATWFSNPNTTRYFFAPSAIPLRKMEGYYQNAYLLANSVNVGVTDHIAVGGGVVIPLLFYVTPKISFKAAKNFYLGAGVLFTQSFISDFNLSAGIGYGLVTVGNLEHNFTIGAGYGMANFNKEYKNTPMPIVTINGMSRISKRLSLVTENWLIPRAGYNKDVERTDTITNMPIYDVIYQNQQFYSGAVSLGLRFMPGIRTSVDFSVVGIKANPNQNNLIIPYLDFVYKFN